METKDDTRIAIDDWLIIASKGRVSLKVRDVAEVAECSIGNVYNEFGDFDGLILTVNRETVQLLTSKLRTILSDDPHNGFIEGTLVSLLD